MLRVTAYTGGRTLPSARFRVRQYAPALRDLGVCLTERPAAWGAFPPRSRPARPLWGAVSLASRMVDVAFDRGADLTLLQREMISGFFTLERFTSRPRVLDVDDAIWMVRKGTAVGRLAGVADLVIAGNEHVADFFRRFHRNVAVLPTPVDTARFTPAATPPDPQAPVIGWCGTRSGLPFLAGIEDALAETLARHPRARIRVVCDTEPTFARVPPDRVQFIRWSAEREVEALQGMSIGLMPLDEDDWCLGKCSYKMLLYMACAVPVVVTPWGMNRDVLALGDVGFAARDTAQWVSALARLIADPAERKTLGARGLEVVHRDFSLEALAPRLARLLHHAASGHA